MDRRVLEDSGLGEFADMLRALAGRIESGKVGITGARLETHTAKYLSGDAEEKRETGAFSLIIDCFEPLADQ